MSVPRVVRGWWCVVAGIFVVAGRAAAVAQGPTVDRSARAATAPRVYLITVGQGQYVWEKFGHNALWFFDAATGTDEAYNWGVFDFNQPQFLRRFLSGDTRYWVESYQGLPLIEYYKRSDRTVVLQRLNFTPEQAQRALQYARWNAREENKYYRYDYFRDNCSTRVRDVIDRALDGELRTATAGVRGARTYRSESLRLVDDMPFTQLGIDVALGQPADAPLSLWELMFIPMRMRDVVRGLRVRGAGGAPVPLVAEERVLYESRAYHERSDAPALWIPYLVIGLLLGAEFGAIGGLRGRSRAVERIFGVEAAVWATLTGVLGLILLLAWATTRHVFWYRNENLLLLNPLSLWLAILVPLAGRARWARAAAWTAVCVAALGLLALLCKAVPSFRQQNLPIILLVLPAHAAIAVGLWRAARRPAAAATDAADAPTIR